MKSIYGNSYRHWGAKSALKWNIEVNVDNAYPAPFPSFTEESPYIRDDVLIIIYLDNDPRKLLRVMRG